MNKNRLKMFPLCCLITLIPACSSSPKEDSSVKDKDYLEEQAMLQWEHAQKRMKNDGFGECDQDGNFIWKKKVIKKELKILNKREKRVH